MKGLREKFRKNEGFTLVEMLIVVAIIAILIAVSIPLVNTSLEKAREAVDAANHRSAIALANVKYLEDPAKFDALTTGEEFGYTVDDNSRGELGSKDNGVAPKSKKYKSKGNLVVTIAADGIITTTWDGVKGTNPDGSGSNP